MGREWCYRCECPVDDDLSHDCPYEGNVQRPAVRDESPTPKRGFSWWWVLVMLAAYPAGQLLYKACYSFWGWYGR
jgi:hypothetical protein